MCRGDLTSIDILIQCLWEFGATSRLQVNVMELALYSTSINVLEMKEIQACTSRAKNSIKNYSQSVAPSSTIDYYVDSRMYQLTAKLIIQFINPAFNYSTQLLNYQSSNRLLHLTSKLTIHSRVMITFVDFQGFFKKSIQVQQSTHPNIAINCYIKLVQFNQFN